MSGESDAADSVAPVRLRVAHFFLVTAIYGVLYAAGAGSFQRNQPLSLWAVIDELSVFSWAVALACFLAVAWESMRGRAALCAVDALVILPWGVFTGRSVDVSLTIAVMNAFDWDFTVHEYYTLAINLMGVCLLCWLFVRPGKGLVWLWRAALGLMLFGTAINLARLGYTWAGGESNTAFIVLRAMERPRAAALLVIITLSAVTQLRSPTRIGELRWLAIGAALMVCVLMAVVSHKYNI